VAFVWIMTGFVTAIDFVVDDVTRAVLTLAFDVVDVTFAAVAAVETAAGAKIALPEIEGDVAVVNGTTVPLAGVAPTVIEFVIAIGDVVTVGDVAVMAGTTVPIAGVAPTPTAAVVAVAAAEVAGTVAAALVAATVFRKSASSTAIDPPSARAGTPGELTDGLIVGCGFTIIAGGTT
jgi:hypothetical protein